MEWRKRACFETAEVGKCVRLSTAGTEIERSVRDEISFARGNEKEEKTKAGRELDLRQRRNSERMKRRREKKRVEREPRQGQKLGFWTAMRRRGVDNMSKKIRRAR